MPRGDVLLVPTLYAMLRLANIVYSLSSRQFSFEWKTRFQFENIFLQLDDIDVVVTACLPICAIGTVFRHTIRSHDYSVGR
mgnify:FL=1